MANLQNLNKWTMCKITKVLHSTAAVQSNTFRMKINKTTMYYKKLIVWNQKSNKFKDFQKRFYMDNKKNVRWNCMMKYYTE